MSKSRIMKWVTGGLEAFLAIPVLGALVIIGLIWIPLFIMLALHIVTLVFTKQDGGPITGSILGIVASCLGWIPFVGWILHVLAAIFLMVNAAQPDSSSQAKVELN